MEVHFTPETEATLNELATLKRCGTDQLIEDIMANYITRAILNPEEAHALFEEKQAARFANRK